MVNVARIRDRLVPRIAAVGFATVILGLLVTSFSPAQDRPEAFAGPPSFADIVEKVSPAVVAISVAKEARMMPTAEFRRLPPGAETAGRSPARPRHGGGRCGG